MTMLRYAILFWLLAFGAFASVAQASDPVERARQAYLEYEFDTAEELLDKLDARQRKARKEISAESRELRAEIVRAREMLDRVENIEIIDSVNVARDEFFLHIPLSVSAGRIGSVKDILPEGFSAASFTSVYSTEDGQSFIWGADRAGKGVALVTADRLADGSMSPAVRLDGELAPGGDANFPFLLSDGVTLYYGATGDDSMGGYDIFMSRRDGSSFLQPQNVGMPYNSPYDDFMLAIDDATGAGWWATDRNCPGDSVTVYTFIPSEMRRNYDVGTPGLVGLALVKSIAATQVAGKDYAKLRSAIASAARRAAPATTPEFYFALPGRRVYTRFEQFRNDRARAIMQDLLDAQDSYDSLAEELAGMRRRYKNGDRGVAPEITDGESRLESLRAKLRSLSNEVIRAEVADGL